MSFKKMVIPLKEACQRLEISDYTPLQKEIIPKIKSGSDLMIVAPDGAGKTTAMVMSVMQKLEGRAIGDAPRALIYIKDKKAALALEAAFEKFISKTDLRLVVIFDEQKLYNQKDDLFFGADIVITTAKRFSDIYFQSGLAMSELRMIWAEDAQSLSRSDVLEHMARITESVDKCQIIVLANDLDKKLNDSLYEFLEDTQVLEFD